MSVLKRNSVFFGGGVDISNTIEQPKVSVPDSSAEQSAKRLTPEQQLAYEMTRLEQREWELNQREQKLMQELREIEETKNRTLEQGKELILEAKRRAEAIVSAANDNAQQIVSDAEANRDSVFIKAKAEGFEQGKRDGNEACLAAGRDILEEARAYTERINSEKEQLFAEYENDIFEAVIAIARKVTLDSITAKDNMAVRRLIKKAAKEFRNSERIKITLNENGANEELVSDYEYLKELCGGIPHIEVELLKDAEPGTVIVDNGSEIVDAGIQTQLKMIHELGGGMFTAPKRKKSSKSDENSEDEE